MSWWPPGDGTQHLTSDLNNDLQATAEIDRVRIDAIVRHVRESPRYAGDAFWATQLNDHEVRSIVTTAVVDMLTIRPSLLGEVRAMLAWVKRSRERQDVRAILGGDGADARTLLWQIVVAWAAATEPEVDDGD